MTRPATRSDLPAPATATRPGMPARRALVVMLAAFLLGALLTAPSLAETAAAQSPGWRRGAALAVTDSLVAVAETLRFDVPGRWIGEIRGGDDDLAVAPQDRTVFVPTPDRPVSLWVVGDSLTDTLGPALVNRSEATGVAAASFDIQYSSGLTRPQILDWPRRFASVLAADPADIVVFMVGANDAQPIETEGRWVGLDDPAWTVEYRSRVREAIDTLTAWTATVVWVGQPVPRNADAARTMAMMNEIYRGEAAGRDDVLYVDAWAIFAGEDGGYEPYLRNDSGDRVLMRRPDGVHLTPAGGEHLAGVVLEALRQVWAIPG